jgi:hypothetical protein
VVDLERPWNGGQVDKKGEAGRRVVGEGTAKLEERERERGRERETKRGDFETLMNDVTVR